MSDKFSVIKKVAKSSFVLKFLITLFFNALIAIGALSYREAANTFSPSIGWRKFTDLFGGLGKMIVIVIVISLMLLIVAYATSVKHTSNRHRFGSKVALVGVLFACMFWGHLIVENFPVEKFIALLVFLGVVLLEVLIEEMFAKRAIRRAEKAVAEKIATKEEEEAAAAATLPATTPVPAATATTP
jgi:hypothetical protein